MNLRTMAAISVLALGLAACQQGGGYGGGSYGGGGGGYGTKETVGTLGGAALGGWAGSNIGSGSGRLAATAAGVLLGGFLGNQMGQSLDRADRTYDSQNTYSSLETAPTGQASSWRNPDSGNSGTFTPTNTYMRGDQPCREFQQSIVVGGRTENAYGTACRQPDGSWRIVE